MSVPAITSFQGEHRFLSNFHPAPVMLGLQLYPTVEHAYQASKTESIDERMTILREPTPGRAKRAGRTVTLRDDWLVIRIAFMRGLLDQKFAPGSVLSRALEATGDAQLIEGNRWGDRFWGVCDGRGENMLGRLLMGVRATNRNVAINEHLHQPITDDLPF